MKSFRVLVASILLIGLQFNLQAEGLYLGFGLGAGDVAIDAGSFSEITSSEDTDGVALNELVIGYEFNNNLALEVADYNRGNLFSDTELDDVNLGVIYNFPSQTSTNFFVKSGIKFWSLDFTRGGGLFSSGEPRTSKKSGEDIFIQLGLDYSFYDSFKLGVAYDLSNTEFGQIRGGKITFKWFPNK